MVTADFSLEIVQMRKQGSNMFKYGKKKTVNLEFYIQQQHLSNMKVTVEFFNHMQTEIIHHQQINTARNTKGRHFLSKKKMITMKIWVHTKE